MQSFRFALRQLATNPGFTAAVVVTLGLGIGVNTAVFSLVNEVLLRSLPVKDPGELVLFRNVEGHGGPLSRAGENNSSIDPVTGRNASTSFSLLTFERFQAYNPTLSAVFAYAPFNDVTLLIDGEPETIKVGQFVSGDYYEGLGVPSVVGRTLTRADDQVAAPLVAVISYRYWESRFRFDADVVGKTIAVNKVPVTVVGVTPRGFAGALQIGESAELTLPIAHHSRLQPDRAVGRAQPSYWWVRIMGRLAPGTSARQAAAGLEPVFQAAAREGWLAGRARDQDSSSAMPGMSTLVADPGGQGENNRRAQYKESLRILLGLVSLVLLAACTNVANLLLARGAARRREFAMRLALGAGRRRIVGHLLMESALLASGGAALGVVFAYWTRGLLVGLRQFGGAPAVLGLPIDARVLAFTVGAAFLTAVLVGLLPALRTTRIDLSREFQGGARLLGHGAQSRLTRGLMVVQVALSTVLLISTGLFVHTLRNLQAVDPGFNPRGLLLFRIDAAAGGYERVQFTAIHTRVQERLEALPGVQAATYARVPLLAGTRSNRRISVPGYVPRQAESMIFNVNGIAPNFLAAMEIPLMLGRPFDHGDHTTAAPVAIVNQAFTRKFYGTGSPVGQTIRFVGMNPTAKGTDIQIVGLVRDAKYTGVREAAPVTIYLPAAQMLEGTATYYIRARSHAVALEPAIRKAVKEVDATLPVSDVRTQDHQLERLTSQERLFARLAGLFGGIALALACVGLYGLMSYVVLRRTGEVGVRMALGALPRDVLRMVLLDAAGLVALGLTVGASAAFMATRLIEPMLFDVARFDPATYGAVSIILTLVAFLASVFPARRAAHVDPMTALRS